MLILISSGSLMCTDNKPQYFLFFSLCCFYSVETLTVGHYVEL